jgi:hypothetical protein
MNATTNTFGSTASADDAGRIKNFMEACHKNVVRMTCPGYTAEIIEGDTLNVVTETEEQ